MTEAGSNGGPRKIGVQQFDRALIADHLDRHGLKYLTDADGDFRVDFSTEDGHTISALLLADGPNAEMFVINIVCSALAPKTLWPKVIFFCNRWNAETRFPKAYLQVPADTDALFAAVHLEGQFPMSAGTTQLIVDEIINTILATGVAFWERMMEERVLADDLDDETPND